MALITRRNALQVGVGALAGTTMLGSGSLRAQIAVKDVAPPKFEIESGAALRVLRPSKFVQGDETLFLENSKKFTDQTGVAVTVTSESWEDLRPKTATAAAMRPTMGSAVAMAAEMGVDLLTEGQYRALQELGEFDTKTSSWISTPPEVRKLGGALFCDRRYGQVFLYHNGAQSYYGARAFRGALRV